MVELSKYQIVFLIFISNLIFFSGCALQLPPGGGDIDKSPPQIIETLPLQRSINYTGNAVEFTFDKYLDKRSFKDAVFFSPAPETPPEFDWSGKSVRITFLDTLKKNITYNITIGTDVTDYYARNKMAESFNLTFSTGNLIDVGEISGKVYAKQPAGTLVFGYLVNSNSDSLFSKKPDYVSQVGTNGKFVLGGLAKGKYRVFAVKNDAREFTYRMGQDKIGIPYSDFELTKTDSLVNDVNFVLTEFDTVAATLKSAIMTDINHILITFSKEIDVLSLKKENIYVSLDSSEQKYPVKALFKGKAREKEIFAILTQSIDKSKEYSLQISEFSDKFGNKKTGEKISLVTNQKPDTTAPDIYSILPGSEAIETIEPVVKIFFDDAVVDLNKNAFSVFDTLKQTYKFELTKIDDASVEIKVTDKLKSQSSYSVGIKLNDIVDYAGNKRDSSFKASFNTLNELDFTAVSGKVINFDTTKKSILVLENVKASQSQNYNESKNHVVLGKDGKFHFKRIVAGQYKLYLYYSDKTGDKIFQGSLIPFQFADKLIYFNKTLDVPARWEVGDVVFDLSKELVTEK